MENILLSCHHIDLNLNEVPILEDINLSLNAGEFHLLIGENGTGKTSIVNILSGVYPAGSFTGSISYLGKMYVSITQEMPGKRKLLHCTRTYACLIT